MLREGKYESAASTTLETTQKGKYGSKEVILTKCCEDMISLFLEDFSQPCTDAIRGAAGDQDGFA